VLHATGDAATRGTLVARAHAIATRLEDDELLGRVARAQAAPAPHAQRESRP
jgi:hypothetical protein